MKPDLSSVETPAAPRSRLRAAAAFLRHVAAWTVICAMAFVLGATVVVPKLAGAQTYTILSGSMEPKMPPGTLVVVRPASAEQIGVGTVITYQLESGKPTVVTHRVVSQGLDGDGRSVLRTRGDANEAVDTAPVLPVQVKGRMWYALPYLGYVSAFITGSQRQLLISIAVGALLLYSATMFTGAVRDRRRRGGPCAV